MSKMAVSCPTCLQKYSVERNMAGKQLRCASPKCGRTFVAPQPDVDVIFAEATAEEPPQRTATPHVDSETVTVSEERVGQILNGGRKPTAPPPRPKAPTPFAIETQQDAVSSVASTPVSQGQTSAPDQPIEESFAFVGVRLFWLGLFGLVLGLLMPTFVHSAQLRESIHNAGLATQKLGMLISSLAVMLSGTVLRAASRKPIGSTEKLVFTVVITLLFTVWILPFVAIIGLLFLQ